MIKAKNFSISKALLYGFSQTFSANNFWKFLKMTLVTIALFIAAHIPGAIIIGLTRYVEHTHYFYKGCDNPEAIPNIILRAQEFIRFIECDLLKYPSYSFGVELIKFLETANLCLMILFGIALFLFYSYQVLQLSLRMYDKKETAINPADDRRYQQKLTQTVLFKLFGFASMITVIMGLAFLIHCFADYGFSYVISYIPKYYIAEFFHNFYNFGTGGGNHLDYFMLAATTLYIVLLILYFALFIPISSLASVHIYKQLEKAQINQI